MRGMSSLVVVEWASRNYVAVDGLAVMAGLSGKARPGKPQPGKARLGET